MPRLPKPKEAIRAATRLGFIFVRQKGSHAIYRNSKGIRITIPIHGSKELGPTLFKQILRDLNISAEDFWKLI